MNLGVYLLRREHAIEISSPFWLLNLSTFSKNGWYASLQNESTIHTIYMFPYYGQYIKTRYVCCLFNHI